MWTCIQMLETGRQNFTYRNLIRPSKLFHILSVSHSLSLSFLSANIGNFMVNGFPVVILNDPVYVIVSVPPLRAV